MDEQTKRLVEEAEARASKATEGPWAVCAASNFACSCGLVYSIPADMPVCTAHAHDEDAGASFTHEERVANAHYIAHARTDVPALCAKVRELDAEVERLRHENEELKDAAQDAAWERDTRD